MAKKEKKSNKKGKKQRKGRKHESVKVWEKYEVKGDTVSTKNNFCPRCGPGTFLSKQKNRKYCGKCGYTDFQKVAPQPAEQSRQPGNPEGSQ